MTKNSVPALSEETTNHLLSALKMKRDQISDRIRKVKSDKRLASRNQSYLLEQLEESKQINQQLIEIFGGN